MPITRIRWTPEERNAVIAAVAKHLNEGARIGEAIRQGQQVLPPRRWRPLESIQAAADIAAAAKKLAATTLPRSIKAQMDEHQAHIDALTAFQQAIAEPQPEAPKDTTIEDLMQLIAAKLAGAMKTEIVKVVKELEHEFKVAKHNPEYEPTGKVLPKVVIIGLLAEQAIMIEREYGARYGLKFIHADDAKHYGVVDADAYLLMKNFISHAVYEKYQGFKNHVLIDGGMTALRGWLSTKGTTL